MSVTLTGEQRADVKAVQRRSQKVRHWKRYQAISLQAGSLVAGSWHARAVGSAHAGCRETSVTNWTTAWRPHGMASLREGMHCGAARRLDRAAEQCLAVLLTGDPQGSEYEATGWTVPLLRADLAERACAWLSAIVPADRWRLSGFLSPLFQWPAPL